jgi:putative cell wall-binding protein/spore germination protein YaaH
VPDPTPRRHGALASLLVVPLLVGLLGAPGAPAGSAPANGAALPPSGTVEAGSDPAAPLTEAQLSRRLTREVYGFAPWWELDSAFLSYIRYDLLTTIALFSFGYGSDGRIVESTRYDRLVGPLGQALIAAAHAQGVRVELSFAFSQTLSVNDAFFVNAVAQATAISQTVALVEAMGADGVNLDVERLSADRRPGYAAFAANLRAALRAKNPIATVSVATNGAISGARMAAAALNAGADRAFLMGYSYRTSGTSPVGSNSPLVRFDEGWDLTSSVEAYEDEGAPLDRVLLGLPYYGLSRPTTDDRLHGTLRSVPSGSRPCPWNPGYPNLFVRDLARVPAGTTIGYDSLEHAAWFATRDATSGIWCQSYVDTPGSLRVKHDLALKRGLAGVGIWALGYDRGRSDYWAALAASFSVIRLAGADRYATAAAVSANTFQPGVPVAFVATGEDAPDAIAAGPVAARLGGPVLLVTGDAIPASTASELARLKPGRIVVLGGPGAVSDGVVTALGPATTGGVTRLAGPDRYATAAAISASHFGSGVPVAYLATGLDFPDALGASAVGGVTGGPVLLVEATAIPSATAAELSRLAPKAIVLVGGEAAVSAEVVTAAQAFTAGTVSRAAGPDRAATAAALAMATFEPGVPVAYVATGFAFPDALAAAPVAGRAGGPLLLVGSDLPAATRAALEALRPRRIVVVGGPGVVPERILPALRDILAGS